MRLSERLGHATAAFLHPPDDAEARLRGIIRPHLTPLRATESGESARQEAALSLLDDDVIGFALITVRNAEEPHATVFAHVNECLWPEVVECMATLATDVADRIAQDGAS